jgi:hypothetical protein
MDIADWLRSLGLENGKHDDERFRKPPEIEIEQHKDEEQRRRDHDWRSFKQNRQQQQEEDFAARYGTPGGSFT